MTGRKKLEIGSIFPYFVPPAGTPPSLFRLFANATHKINHARRNFTFTCKITPRVNFYMFRTLDDFNDQPFHATGIGAILIFEGQISSKRIQPTGLWTIHFRESIARTPYFQAFAFSQTFYYTFFTPFLQLPTSHLLTNHPLHDNTNPSSFSKNYALTVFVKSLDASLVQCRSLQKYALNNAV